MYSHTHTHTIRAGERETAGETNYHQVGKQQCKNIEENPHQASFEEKTFDHYKANSRLIRRRAAAEPRPECDPKRPRRSLTLLWLAVRLSPTHVWRHGRRNAQGNVTTFSGWAIEQGKQSEQSKAKKKPTKNERKTAEEEEETDAQHETHSIEVSHSGARSLVLAHRSLCLFLALSTVLRLKILSLLSPSSLRLRPLCGNVNGSGTRTWVVRLVQQRALYLVVRRVASRRLVDSFRNFRTVD